MAQEKLELQTNISLLTFFPAKLLSMIFYSLVFTTVIFMVFWPWGKNLSHFLRQHQSPFLAFPVFAATAVLSSYIQLRYGRGELLQKERDIRYFSSQILKEREQTFSQYDLPMLLLHTTFFLLPFSPLLILSASVSEFSLQTLSAAFGLIWMSGLLFRAGGSLLYRLWGAASPLGYFLGRFFFGLFLFLVPIYLPQISPLRLLHALSHNTLLMDGKMSLYTAYWLCQGTMCLMILVMCLLTYVIGGRIEQKNGKAL